METIISFSAFGALLGSVFTILFQTWFTNYLQTKRILKEQKVQLLRDLMASKFSGYTDQRGAEAINFIPVLFVKDQKVINAYAEYHSAVLNTAGDILNRFTTLVVEISRNVGIHLNPVDLMRVPILSYKRQIEDNDYRKKYEAMRQEANNSGKENILKMKAE